MQLTCRIGPWPEAEERHPLAPLALHVRAFDLAIALPVRIGSDCPARERSDTRQEVANRRTRQHKTVDAEFDYASDCMLTNLIPAIRRA
jgi:hypothetical protein